MLSSLVKLYDQLEKQGKVLPQGYVKARIAFGIEIREDGSIREIYPLGNTEDKNPAAELVSPEFYGHTAAITPAFLWDTPVYLLGYGSEKDRASEKYEASKKFHVELLKASEGPFAKALINFFENYSVDKLTEFQKKLIEENLTRKFTFIFNGEFAVESKELVKCWEKHGEDQLKGCPKAYSIVTGEYGYIEDTLPNLGKLPIPGSSSTTSALISYGKDSFCSYGHTASHTAEIVPIDKKSAFKFSAALEYLTSHGDTYRMKNKQENSMILFWSESSQTEYNDIFRSLFDSIIPYDKDKVKENAILYQDNLKYYLNCVAQGKKINVNDVEIEYDNDFYILELFGSKARIGIKRFLRNNFGDILKNAAMHYEDIKIQKRFETEPDIVPLYMIIKELYKKAKKGEKSYIDNGSKRIMDELYNCIIDGRVYPCTLLNKVLMRIKAEIKDIDNYAKAAILKAYINRRIRKIGACGKLKEEITVNLNQDSKEVSYNLGRLFATYLYVQNKVAPELSATIKDRYFNGCMTTPAYVFPAVNKLSLIHLSKLEGDGAQIYFSNLISEILSKIEEFPRRLTLEQQAAFYLGYYHQRRDFYTKKQ